MRTLFFIFSIFTAAPLGAVSGFQGFINTAQDTSFSPASLREPSAPEAKTPGLPLLTLKTDIGALFNPFKQAFAFGADLRLSPRMSVDAGAGAFIGSVLQYADHRGESYTGLRVQAGLKYYLKQSERVAFHLGLEVKYHDIKHIAFREIFRQGQQYIEFYPVERTVRTQGLSGRAGWQFYVGRNKQFVLEPFGGFGIQFNQVSRLLPPDAEIVEQPVFTFEFEPGNSATPYLLLGFHVGLVLW